MRRSSFSFSRWMLVTCAILSLIVMSSGLGAAAAQKAAPAANASQTIVPQLIKFSGTLTDLAGKPVSGPVDVTFSLYSEESGGTPLWYESQTVNADAAGQYTALLGAMTTTGVPMDLFASGQARWLGVMVRGLPEQSRVLLVSVPYAMTSGNAEMLGGKPASDYLLASSLSSTTNAANAAAVTAATTAGRASTTGMARNSRQMSITTGGTANYLAGWVDSSTLGTSAMYQDPTTNNIGIGTTTPAAPLDVATANTTFNPTGNSTLRITNTAAAGQSALDFVTNGTLRGRMRVDYAGNMALVTNGGGFYFQTGGDIGAGSTSMVVTPTGKLGVGTTTPGAELQVATANDTNPPNVPAWDARHLVVGASGNTSGGVGISYSQTNNVGFIQTVIPNKAWGNLVLQSGGGNVGIGTASPTATLEVNGTAKFDQPVTFASSQNFGGTSTVIMGSTETLTSTSSTAAATLTNSGGGDILDASGNSGSVFKITNSGGITSSALVTQPSVTDTSSGTGDCSSGLSGCVSANVLGGYLGATGANTISPRITGATISGGGGSTAAGADPNSVTDDFGAVGGGAGNTAGNSDPTTDDAAFATVAGGFGNTASGYAATVAGGTGNTASGSHTTISGGDSNAASGAYATIAGGESNIANGSYATVAGGFFNTASGSYGFAAGGFSNSASGNYSFAGGCEAQATEYGSFVWSGYTSATGCKIVTSSAAGQFKALAPGGFEFISAAGGTPVTITGPGGVITGNGSGLTNLSAGSLAGTDPSAVTFSNTGNSFTGNGSGLTSLTGANVTGTVASATNASELGGLAASGYAQLAAANTFTTNQTITGNLTLSGSINSALTLQGNVTDTIASRTSSNVIGGWSGNTVSAPGSSSLVTGATIGGGGASGYLNTVTDDFGTVGGGLDNTAGDSNSNTQNVVGATVAGGYGNTASGAASTVAGGDGNIASGYYSFAAGCEADAAKNGDFVWSGATGGSACTTVSTSGGSGGEFVALAPGGFHFYTGTAQNTGCSLAAGGGTWACASDRNVKANFAPVNLSGLLTRLNRIPITTWNYKTQKPSIRHLGPMAQDFYKAFHLGATNKQIGLLDEGGVALAGVQALYRLSLARNKEIARLKRASALKDAQLEAMARQNRKLASEVAQLDSRLRGNDKEVRADDREMRSNDAIVAALEARLARDEAQEKGTNARLARLARRANEKSRAELARVQF